MDLGIVEIFLQEFVDAPIRRGKVIGQEAHGLLLPGEHGAGQAGKLLTLPFPKVGQPVMARRRLILSINVTEGRPVDISAKPGLDSGIII